MGNDPNLSPDPELRGDPAADPADRDRMQAIAAELADRIEAALAGWVVQAVERVHLAWAGACPPAVRAAAERAGADARHEVAPRVRALLALDIDEQPTTPLAVVRAAVRFPTAVLHDAGVPPVVRDDVAQRQLPEDVYDLAPAAFADLGPEVAEAGITWGAAKAHLHLQRRRRDGQR